MNHFRVYSRRILKETALLLHSNSYSTEATFQVTKPYKLHLLKQSPQTTVNLKKEDALEYYRQMQTIRKLEATCNAMYKSKIVRGFCHLYSGQEATGVGVKASMGPGDACITSYRCHAWCYLMEYVKDGPFPILAELTGTSLGCARGKGGSMHMYGDHFYGGNAIVGAQVPVGVGVSLAFQYRKTKGVCVSLYGDGASNNGQIAEVMNMAKLLKIPAIFLCENNLYGMGTPAGRSSANTEYYKRGDVIPGIWVDGQDILAVREVMRFARDFVLNSGEGPIVIECETYRYSGHSLSDPGTTYRTREEIQEVRKTRDPINIFKDKIIASKLVVEGELKKVEDDAKAVVDGAAKKAKAGKEIGLDELTTDIYANNVITEVRNVGPLNPLKHKYSGKAINK